MADLLNRRELIFGFFSPYEEQTNNFFLSEFREFWGEIVNYGISHPFVVPYINEDPMLICSLIELGKTRFLVGDGTSWIDTGIEATSFVDTNIRIDIYGITYDSGGSGVYAFCLDGIGGSMGTSSYVGINGGKLTYGTFYGGANEDVISDIQADFGSYHHLYVDYMNKIAGCDSNSLSFAFETPPAVNANYPIFGWLRYGIVIGHAAKKKRVTYSINSNIIGDFVPFVSQIRNGMLDIHDLENPVFHPNIGSGVFTTEVINS